MDYLVSNPDELVSNPRLNLCTFEQKDPPLAKSNWEQNPNPTRFRNFDRTSSFPSLSKRGLSAVCPENDALVEFMRKWWTDLSENPPKSHSDNTEKTIQRAFTNVCHCKTHIKTLKDFQSVKGIEKGVEFMHKQELIDAADSSGLARVPIAPEKGRWKQGLHGSSKKEWYSGWSAMGKLVDKGLVVKTSCPAKICRYKLTEAGRQAACDCLSRSNMFGSHSLLINRKEQSDSKKQDDDNLNYVSTGSDEEVELISVDLVTKPTRDNIHLESLDRVPISCVLTRVSFSSQESFIVFRQRLI